MILTRSELENVTLHDDPNYINGGSWILGEGASQADIFCDYVFAHDKKWANEGKIELDKLNSKLKDFNILPLQLIA
ncbi:MAG: hypothetical protein N4R51_01500 [Lactobacillus crispatus]|nr:hypothetical protein [Lactobacillus crispatus]MCT7769461.1 hypothetical protein [Lactobacillus crispatus]